MLIRLDRTAVDAALQGEEKDRSLKAIENLLRAHDGRKHLLVVEASASRLLESDLSKWARGTLRSLLDTLSETGDLPRRLRIHVIVGAGQGFDGRVVQLGERHVLQHPLTAFEDFERAVRAVLIAEDETDADVYLELGRAMVFAEHDMRRAPVLEIRGGGGSSLHDAYSSALKSGRMTLAVTDSDRDSPHGGIGPTAHGLRRAVADVDGWLVDLGNPTQNRQPTPSQTRAPACAVVLHVRMLENLIPLAIHEQASSSKAVPALMALRTRSASPPWLDHAHLKDGLRLRQIDEKPEAEQRFWREACSALGFSDCREPPECASAKDCRCEVVPALDHKAAEGVLAWLERAPLEQACRLWGFRESSPIEAPAQLRQLAEWIMCWGFAPPSARAST